MIEKLHDAGLRSEYAYMAGSPASACPSWPGRRRCGPRRRDVRSRAVAGLSLRHPDDCPRLGPAVAAGPGPAAFASRIAG